MKIIFFVVKGLEDIAENELMQFGVEIEKVDTK